MPATQPQQEGPQAGDDECGESRPVPTADEDDPHDVPDEQVIEKTLPAPPDRGQRGRPS